jgi:uncharacterized lipoprotein YddW (UPF0748 family)
MESIGQMIINDENPDSIRDAIITNLYAKAAERVEDAKPYVAASIFNDEYEDDEDEYEDDDSEEDEEDEEDEYEDSDED